MKYLVTFLLLVLVLLCLQATSAGNDIYIYNADAIINLTASTPPDDTLNSSDALPQDGVKTILIYDADAFIDITASTTPEDALDSSDALPQDGVKTILIYDADATDSLSLKTISTGEYNPKLEIPAYTPYWIYAHKGTGLTYTIKVTNEGTKTDTINLSTSNTRGWDIQLSQTSVTLAPGQSTRVYLLLTIEEYVGSNTITITGTSQGDTSKTSDCTVYAADLGEGRGLFAATLIFKSNDAQEHILELEAPDDVKISDDTVTLNPSHNSKKVNVVFDPKASSLGSNLISIGVTDSLNGEGELIYILFEGDEMIATSFDMATDSYSFKNFKGKIVKGYCSGMSRTSILYFRGMLTRPYNSPNTFALKNEGLVETNIQIHSWKIYKLLLLGWIVLESSPAGKDREYSKLVENIANGNPMLLCTFEHVMVAYKIVREGDKAYIFVYDSDKETYNISNALSFSLAFPYATYNLTSHEFDDYYGHTSFCVLGTKADALSLLDYMLYINCPVNVTITDQYDRIISDDGTNEIPDAIIIAANEEKLFYLPADLTYLVNITAYDSGNFTTTAVSPVSDNTATINVFDNISITENTHATLDLAANEVNPMYIDYDGDGTIDEEKYPDVNETIEINQPPNASFTYSPAHPVVNETIIFNASESKDHDGYITNYKWEFGDGNIADTTEPIINQTYDLAGEYTVNLTVTDDDGATNSSSQLVHVTLRLPPKITSYAPSSHVNDTICNWEAFNVTIDQTVNVSWYLNDMIQHTNESVREASCMLHAEVAGEHNVTAKASNINGTDMQTWVWNVTEPTAPVQFESELESGWNLISVPLNLISWQLGAESVVGDPLNVTPKNSLTSIYRYDITSGIFDKCDHFTGLGWWPATGSESFTELEPGRGYWVMAKNDCTLTFTGTAPSDLDIALNTSWNLIGWYSMEEASLGQEAVVGDPLNVTPKNSLTSIYRYNTTEGEFEKCDHFDNLGWWPATGSESFTKLEPCGGYWVMAKNGCVWRQ